MGHVGAGIGMGAGIERSGAVAAAAAAAAAASIGGCWCDGLRGAIVEVEERVGPILGRVGGTRTVNPEPRLLSSRRGWMDDVALGPGAFVNVRSEWETEPGDSAEEVVANMVECL